jgi:hypothetical protein
MFAKRATRWEQDTVVSRKMAFDHYWGPNAKKAVAAPKGKAKRHQKSPVVLCLCKGACWERRMTVERSRTRLTASALEVGKLAAWWIIGLTAVVCTRCSNATS